IGHVHPAIRSKRAFSARLCASARSPDVSIAPAVVRPAAAACRNPRRSTWCESLRLSVIVRYLSEGAKRPWSKSRQMIQEAATPPEAHNGPPLTPDRAPWRRCGSGDEMDTQIWDVFLRFWWVLP